MGNKQEHLKTLVSATDLPVNADYESGFARDLESLAENVRLAVDAGVAGLSIEDIRADSQSGLYDTATSVARIRAARAAIDQTGEDVVLVARTEILLSDPSRLSEAIDRLVAFAGAGADCVPGRLTVTRMQTFAQAWW